MLDVTVWIILMVFLQLTFYNSVKYKVLQSVVFSQVKLFNYLENLI